MLCFGHGRDRGATFCNRTNRHRERSEAIQEAAGRPRPPGSPRRFAPREDGGGAALVWKRRNPLKSPESDEANPSETSAPCFSWLAAWSGPSRCLGWSRLAPQAGRPLARDRANSGETRPGVLLARKCHCKALKRFDSGMDMAVGTARLIRPRPVDSRQHGRRGSAKGGMTLPAEAEELIASLNRQILALQAEVAELRRRLGLDSSNSSKPPSSDGLRKKPRVAGSLRGRSGKPSGGQKGHQGGTLRQVADPDFVVRHEACACGHCGWPLDPKSAKEIERRQVFDLPERPLLVTEHQASIYRCAQCRGVTKAEFPDGVVSPTQYGERIRAAAIYLNIHQLIPEDRVAQALNDLFGAPLICPASVVAWVGKKAANWAKSTRPSANAWPRPRFAASMRRAIGSLVSCTGCTHVEFGLHFLSRGRKTRRHPHGFAGRRRRA